MRKSGVAFHCRHNKLFEFVLDYDERVAVISSEKPANEQELRRRLFQLIPDEKMPGRESVEWEVLDKARETYDRARATLEKERETLAKAWATVFQVEGTYEQAWKTFAKKYGSELEQLHKELCPDCPWDGKTIFPEKKEGG